MGNKAIALFFPIVSPDYLFAEIADLIVGKTQTIEILKIPDHSPSEPHETIFQVEELQKQVNNLIISQILSVDSVEPKVSFQDGESCWCCVRPDIMHPYCLHVRHGV